MKAYSWTPTPGVTLLKKGKFPRLFKVATGMECSLLSILEMFFEFARDMQGCHFGVAWLFSVLKFCQKYCAGRRTR